MGLGASERAAHASSTLPWTASAPEAGQWGVNVADYGALGDGTTDDTASFNDAITDAAGRTILVPLGTYILDNVRVPESTDANLWLADEAVLVHKDAAPTPAMIRFDGDSLTIRGGQIDGNWKNQTTRNRFVVNGNLEQGKRLILERIRVRNTLQAFINLTKFGGELEVEHCEFTGQAEHGGPLGQPSMIIRILTGDPGNPGFCRFNHNRCIGTITPVRPGSSPGGLFLAVIESPDDSDQGNMSVFEGIGNYFWGYGQYGWDTGADGGNDISPFHFYPSWRGARIIGNYFEGCGYAAISAKCVTDFVCTDNVIVDGQVNAQNLAWEGAIDYVPGTHAGSHDRPRAVIANNIVWNPGGESATKRQACIKVSGTPTSIAHDVVVTGNNLGGGGKGIHIVAAKDVTIAHNIIKGGTSSTTGTDAAIWMKDVRGIVMVQGNQIFSSNGSGVEARTIVTEAMIIVESNIFTHDNSSFSYYACDIRGAKLVKLAGNAFSSSGGAARPIHVGGDSNGNSVQLFQYDRSNQVLAGAIAIDYTKIVSSVGDLVGNRSPEGLVAAPVGTTYTRMTGNLGRVLYVKEDGTTSKDWRAHGTRVGTTAELASATSLVNREDKYEGRQVFNTTTNRPVWAAAALPNSAWLHQDGTTAHAPL